MKFLLVLIFPLLAWAEKKTFELPEYKTEKGAVIRDVKIGYETFGTLNADKSNAILITHHFSGNSNFPAYWATIFGKGKALDPEKYFIVSSDTLVNLGVKDPTVITTGPASINPKTKKPYGMKFPAITVTDFVRVQRELLTSLGVSKLHAVVGPSGGGAQAMTWAATYPDDVSKIVNVIGPGLSLPSFIVALLNRWIAPILVDKDWKGGDYYGKNQSFKGFEEAIKLMTWTTVYFGWGSEENELIEEKFSERAKLRAQSFDPNSMIYMARAIQSFDIRKSVNALKADFLFVSAEKDILFPPEIAISAAKEICRNGRFANVVLLKGLGGHLDGLAKVGDVDKNIREFLEGTQTKNKCRDFE